MSSSPATATPTKNYAGHGRLSFAAQNFSGINLPLTEGKPPSSHSKRHSDGSIDTSKLKSKTDGGSGFQHKRRQQRPRRRQTVMETGGPGQDMRKSFLGLPNITPFRRLSLDEEKVKNGMFDYVNVWLQ